MAIPNATTIPEAQMAKGKSYNSTPAAVKEVQNWYDAFVSSIKPGQAGSIEVGEEVNAKSIRMNIRHAANRVGVTIGKAVVTEDAVQFTVAE